jgi:hypothetical protein
MCACAKHQCTSPLSGHPKLVGESKRSHSVWVLATSTMRRPWTGPRKSRLLNLASQPSETAQGADWHPDHLAFISALCHLRIERVVSLCTRITCVRGPSERPSHPQRDRTGTYCVRVQREVCRACCAQEDYGHLVRRPVAELHGRTVLTVRLQRETTCRMQTSNQSVGSCISARELGNMSRGLHLVC